MDEKSVDIDYAARERDYIKKQIIEIALKKKELQFKQEEYQKILEEYISLKEFLMLKEEKVNQIESSFINQIFNRKDLIEIKEEIMNFKKQFNFLYNSFSSLKNLINQNYDYYSFLVKRFSLDNFLNKLLEPELTEIINLLEIDINKQIDHNVNSVNILDIMRQAIKEELSIEKVELKNIEKLSSDDISKKQKSLNKKLK